MSQTADNRMLLKLDNYQIKRGQHFALEHIDWCVKQGEHWCILGPNGCGKTSLLSSITAYSSPSGGSIWMFDEIYGETEWHHVRKQVGIVSSGLHAYIEDDEVAEELVVTGKRAWLTNWRKISPTERAKARRLLKQLDCTRIARCQWRTLSQGERQRVLIARTLMAPIKLLILDEPCSGLDPLARHHFLQRIELLAQQARSPTQIMVTHHVEEIIPSCTHVLLIGKQGVIAQGIKSRVLTSAHLSAAFGNPMRLRKQHGVYRLTIID